MQSDTQLIEALTTAVVAHGQSAEALADRIKKLLDPVPASLVLDCAGHKLAYRKVHAECSQWANNAHPVVGTKQAYVIDDTYAIGSIDVSFWDGRNHQVQFGRPYLREGIELRKAPAKLLREIALNLPARLAAYLDCCQKGTAQNDSLLAEV